MKTLIVGLDGSDHAQHAARYAASLAGCLDARLLLVHVVPSIAMPADAVAYANELLQAHRIRGEALLDSTANAVSRPGVRVDKRLVETGAPAEVLSDLAKQLGAEMIVVGATGLGAVARVLLGSVADRLGHIAPVPVLVVR